MPAKVGADDQGQRQGQIAHLLWTSGWDSTYRLLDLVVVQGRTVQPYYFMTPNRQSTEAEWAAMEAIKGAIEEKSPAIRSLILETIVVRPEDIKPDPWFDKALANLRRSGHLGGQYPDLARMAKQLGVRMEMALHEDDRPLDYLMGDLEKDGGVYRLIENPSSPDLKLFESFDFPLVEMTKKGMGTKAREHGFADLMELTWFCHHPDRHGQACGKCTPCRHTIEEGLGRRIPVKNRIRGNLSRSFRLLTSPIRGFGIRKRLGLAKSG
ncbi:7-cyano-7-deazaguanine synthase [Pseudopontixanthobacter vadosimaris]|uniref:7-cyano-7-deazaguanine synthase n=1 Tax=Pseudopontixanthobacter vadosimaris TaxID=2726450 RepID=UPI001F0EFC3A|nr:7-cyano-7-deazaguanine synthase [Pseudopontixanthobacter vadosimaris]